MNDHKKILVVDDNQEILDLLGRYLDQQGFDVSMVESGAAMRQILQEKTFDLIILDIMMPGEDGLSLCRFVREQNGPPVILLTAMGEETDRIVGLELGADDYMCKPFSPRELLARIKAVLRRTVKESSGKGGIVQAHKFVFGDWLLDIHQQHLKRKDGVTIALSTAEFRLMYAFVTHPRHVLSRDDLLDLTKGREALPFDRSIDNQVSRLRKKIEEDPSVPQIIKTIWGGGYMLAEDVRAL